MDTGTVITTLKDYSEIDVWGLEKARDNSTDEDGVVRLNRLEKPTGDRQMESAEIKILWKIDLLVGSHSVDISASIIKVHGSIKYMDYELNVPDSILSDMDAITLGDNDDQWDDDDYDEVYYTYNFDSEKDKWEVKIDEQPEWGTDIAPSSLDIDLNSKLIQVRF